jgi:hypothetical protein
MSLIGKKVIITTGIHKDVEGYVRYECHHAVGIEACGWFGQTGWYGIYYARKTDIKETQ